MNFPSHLSKEQWLAVERAAGRLPDERRVRENLLRKMENDLAARLEEIEAEKAQLKRELHATDILLEAEEARIFRAGANLVEPQTTFGTSCQPGGHADATAAPPPESL